MTCGALGLKYRLWTLLYAAWLSSRLTGVDVAGDRDDIWGCHHLALLRLFAKPSHMGVDLEGLACHLCYRMNYG
jgi:hypothetical protein